MRGIFVSYRREDTAGWAGRLVSDLRQRFGEPRVFHDIAAIQPGEDFTVAIERALDSCAIVLVLIGPRWLVAQGRNGEARLVETDDPVRIEVRRALTGKDLLVVPVLLGGAAMPSREQLPDDISALAARHAVELSDARWEFDVRQLAEQLAHTPSFAAFRRRRSAMVLPIGFALLIATVVLWPELRREERLLTGTPPASASSSAADSEDPSSSPLQVRPVDAVPRTEPNPTPEQRPAAARLPETRASAVTRVAASKPRAPNVNLDGLWEAPYGYENVNRGRELFEFETRRGDVFGSNWVEGGPQKFSIVDGKLDGDRLKFCVPLTQYAWVGDGRKYVNFRECFDGLVDGDHIRFVATTYLGHPTMAPQSRKFSAERVKK